MLKHLTIIIDTLIPNKVTLNKAIFLGDSLNADIRVFENGLAKNLTGENITLIIKKADGTVVENSLLSSNTNQILKTLSNQVTLFPGCATGQITITDSTGLRSTSNEFEFEVQNIVGSVNLPQSTNDIQSLIDLTNLITRANDSINLYNEIAQEIASTSQAAEFLQAIKNYYDANNPILSSNVDAAILQNSNLESSIESANTCNSKLETENTKAETNLAALRGYGDVPSLFTKMDKFTEDDDGNLLYNGQPIEGVNNASDVNVTAPTGFAGTNVQELLNDIASKAFRFPTTEVIKYIYVDYSNGSDDNDGTENSPFKTLTKAWDSIPYILDGAYIIRMLSDYTFDGTVNLNSKLSTYGACQVGIVTNTTSNDSADFKSINCELKFRSIIGCGVFNSQSNQTQPLLLLMRLNFKKTIQVFGNDDVAINRCAFNHNLAVIYAYKASVSLLNSIINSNKSVFTGDFIRAVKDCKIYSFNNKFNNCANVFKVEGQSKADSISDTYTSCTHKASYDISSEFKTSTSNTFTSV